MTPIRAITTLLTFILGLLVGGVLVAYWLRSSHPNFDDAFISGEVGKLDTAITALREIRAGNVQRATETLETKADAALISLSGPADNALLTIQKEKRDLIEQARQYRSKFPRKTDSPGVDESVAKSLSQSVDIR